MSDHHASAEPPVWLRTGRRVTRLEIFSPAPLDRQGERMAWSLAVAMLALLVFLRWRMQIWVAALVVLFLLLCLAAILISFGIWMERNTQIEVTSDGLRYKNPLRKRRMLWQELTRVEVYPRGNGWRVTVESTVANFSFQTSTVLSPGWGKAIETGVARGEELVSAIIGMANLLTIAMDREGWSCSRGEQQPE